MQPDELLVTVELVLVLVLDEVLPPVPLVVLGPVELEALEVPPAPVLPWWSPSRPEMS